MSVTPPGSTEALTRERTAAKPPPVPRQTPAKQQQRPVEPSEMDSEEDSQLSEDESESEPESVAPPEQVTKKNRFLPKQPVSQQPILYFGREWKNNTNKLSFNTFIKVNSIAVRSFQTRHSAAQVPTVAVMSEASGPPRYPPVRFRSSVHPAPTLPPIDAKRTSLVGVRVEVK